MYVLLALGAIVAALALQGAKKEECRGENLVSYLSSLVRKSKFTTTKQVAIAEAVALKMPKTARALESLSPKDSSEKIIAQLPDDEFFPLETLHEKSKDGASYLAVKTFAKKLRLVA